MVKDGVVLSGHTDVVPVDGQPWDTDPWTLTLKPDNKYYGRGTCDMKAFYAIALAMLPQFQKAGLKKPIHFALSYDEEVVASAPMASPRAWRPRCPSRGPSSSASRP